MGILDIQDNLSQPSQSLYDRFLAQRALLEKQRPDVAAQLPTIGANTPGQRMFETQQQQPVQDLATGLQGLVGQVTQATAGPNAKPKDVQETGSSISQVLSYLDPLKPKETFGPDVGKAMGMPENSGGILGLGIQPIDVLAFALGAAVTGNLPQDKAIATTMQIAGLPGQFRQSQEKNARQFINDKLSAIQAEIASGNLEMRKQEFGLNSDLKNLQILSKMEGLDQLSKRKAVLELIQSGELDINTPIGRSILVGAGVKPEEIKAIMGSTAGERSMTPTELAVFAAGGPRGVTIPQELSPAQANSALEKIRENRQVLLPQAQQQRIETAGASAEATAQSRQRVEAAKNVAALTSVSKIVDNIDTLSKRMHTATNALQANLQGARITSQGLLASNKDVRLYEAQKRAFIGTLSRTLAAERGVLTEGDISRISEAFPSARDTVEVRDAKMAFVRGMMNDVAEVEKMIASNKEPPAALVEKIMRKLDLGPEGASIPQGVTIKRVQ